MTMALFPCLPGTTLDAVNTAITGYPPPGGQRRLFWPTSPVNSGTFRLSIFTLRISRPTVAKTPASAGR